MVIAKKPLVNKDSVNLTNTIINKGGTSPKEQIYEENKNIKITIRLPSKMLNIIDTYLADSISNKTRTCWLREAIEEKVEKEIN
jgi:hypothetical protein